MCNFKDSSVTKLIKFHSIQFDHSLRFTNNSFTTKAIESFHYLREIISNSQVISEQKAHIRTKGLNLISNVKQTFELKIETFNRGGFHQLLK